MTRRKYSFCESVWSPRDAVIRELWGVATVAEIGRRLRCDPSDVMKRSSVLGLDRALARRAQAKAQSAIASERALKSHAARRARSEAEDAQETGLPIQRCVSAIDGSEDVRRALSRAAVSVFELWRLAA